jgi:hypothetical protein
LPAFSGFLAAEPKGETITLAGADRRGNDDSGFQIPRVGAGDRYLGLHDPRPARCSF